MAIPANPTLDIICQEAISRCELDEPVATHIARAKEQWIQEIKTDIQLFQTRHHLLNKTGVIVVRRGWTKFKLINLFPDYEYLNNVDFLEADDMDIGNAQSSVGFIEITLKASDTKTEPERIGRELILTTIPELVNIIAYDPVTKIATVTPPFTVDPTGREYFISTKSYQSETDPLDMQDEVGNVKQPSKVYEYAGELILTDIPDRTYVLKVNYGMNLTMIDESASIFTKLLREWRSLWIQGIIAKESQRARSEDWETERDLYYRMIAALSSKSSGSSSNIVYNDI